MTHTATADIELDRGVPMSHEAERYTLGSILVDDSLYPQISGALQVDDFSLEKHRRIYQRMGELYGRGERIDRVTLVNELMRAGQLESVDGIGYVVSIDEGIPSVANVDSNARIVSEKATLRRLLFTCRALEERCILEQDSPGDLLSDGERSLRELSSRVSTKGNLASAAEIVAGLDLNRIGQPPTNFIRTPYAGLNRHVYGFLEGELIVLGARPSSGKSTAMGEMAIQAARDGHLTSIFSLETLKEAFMTRCACNVGSVDRNKLKYGKLSAVERMDFVRALKDISEMPFFVDDKADTYQAMDSEIRRMKQVPRLVIIDHLHLMQGVGRSENRNQELTKISRELKRYATRNRCTVLLLAQLNRTNEKENRPPELRDLRDCFVGDSLVTNADTGERIEISDIAHDRMKFGVWSVTSDYKLSRRLISRCWGVGLRPVFRVGLRSGKQLTITSEQKLLTIYGWRKLKDLSVGDSIACPKFIPAPKGVKADCTESMALLLGWMIGDGYFGGSPTLTVSSSAEAEYAAALAQSAFPELRPSIKPERLSRTAMRVTMTTGRMCGAGKNPFTAWLRRLGMWGSTGVSKHVPSHILSSGDDIVAAFLRGLFHADGSCMRRWHGSSVSIRLATISERLARDVQHLLSRLHVQSTVYSEVRRPSALATPSTERCWAIRISEREQAQQFMRSVGFLMEKHRHATQIVDDKKNDAGTLFRLPKEVCEYVEDKKARLGLTIQQSGWRNQHKRMSIATALSLAAVLSDPWLQAVAGGDVSWDEMVSVEAAGNQECFDLEVEDLHNFVVGDCLAHNCGALEQDADIVLLLHRKEDTTTENEKSKVVPVEMRIAKQRDGVSRIKIPMMLVGSQYRFVEAEENHGND